LPLQGKVFLALYKNHTDSKFNDIMKGFAMIYGRTKGKYNTLLPAHPEGTGIKAKHNIITLQN
jgi:hypothetical protein